MTRAHTPRTSVEPAETMRDLRSRRINILFLRRARRRSLILIISGRDELVYLREEIDRFREREMDRGAAALENEELDAAKLRAVPRDRRVA